MQANRPYSFPNNFAPAVSNGFPQFPCAPMPPQSPFVSFPLGFGSQTGHNPLPTNLNCEPRFPNQPMPQWNLTPTVLGQKRRRIDVSFGFQSRIQVQEEKQLGYTDVSGWNRKIEEFKFGKWISDQNCKRLETECRQLKADVAKLRKVQLDQILQTEEDPVTRKLEEDKEHLENELLQLRIDVAKLSRLEMLKINQIQQTEQDPVIEELKKGTEDLEKQVAQLQTANQVAHEAKIQVEAYCKQLDQRLNRWEKKHQGTQTDDTLADHIEFEKQQAEMKEQIRIQKEENEARNLISEKRENSLEIGLQQAENRIKALKEAKKKLQAQGISSQFRFKKKVDELEEKLKAANSYQQLQAMSYDSLEVQVKELKSELAETKESLSLETREKEKAVREVKKLEANAKEKEEDVKRLLSGMTLNEFVAKHQELEHQHRLTEAELNKTYSQLSAIKDTNETLTKRCEDLKMELKERSEQRQSLLTQHQDTFSELSKLQSEHRELKRNLHTTVSQLDKETAEKNNFAKNLQLVENRLSERITSRNEQQEKLFQKQMKKCAKLEEKLKAKTEQLRMANADRETLEMKLESLENALDGLNKQMDELTAFVESGGSESKDLQTKLSLLEEENNRLKTKIQKITREESSQTEPNDLESEFTQLQKRLDDTEIQFCQLLSAKDEQIVAVHNQLAKTRQQLDHNSGIAKGNL